MRFATVQHWASAVITAGVIVSSAASAQVSSRPGNVDQHRVLAEAHTGENWMVNGGSFGSQHFSPLKQINDKNVGKLGLAWSLDIDSPMGMATEPIVVDGTIYVSAIARSGLCHRCGVRATCCGDSIRTCASSAMRNSATARTNRGVAVWEGKVFVGTGDCRMHRARCGLGQATVGIARLRRYRQPASPEHRGWAAGRCTSATTDRTPACAARWSPSMPNTGQARVAVLECSG